MERENNGGRRRRKLEGSDIGAIGPNSAIIPRYVNSGKRQMRIRQPYGPHADRGLGRGTSDLQKPPGPPGHEIPKKFSCVTTGASYSIRYCLSRAALHTVKNVGFPAIKFILLRMKRASIAMPQTKPEGPHEDTKCRIVAVLRQNK